MNKLEIETTDIEEIIVRQDSNGRKQIIINGARIDLSKLVSMSIDIDCHGIRVNTKLFNYPLPVK